MDFVELRDDDPFDGRGEYKLTRVSEFTAKISSDSPLAVSSNISHYTTEPRSDYPAGQTRTRTYYNCPGMSCLEVDYGLLQNTASSILLHLVVNRNDSTSVDLRLRSKMTGMQVIFNRGSRTFVTEPSQKKKKKCGMAVSRSLGMAAFDLLLDESSAKIISLID